MQLELCGPARVLLYGTPLKLTPRRFEILALLALHPHGLDLDALHFRLYGGSAVGFSTLKAELSSLRRLLGGQLASRPYRLTLATALDALELQVRLTAGDLANALALYRGAFLPESNSLTLSEWRLFLESALRESSLQRAEQILSGNSSAAMRAVWARTRRCCPPSKLSFTPTIPGWRSSRLA